MAARYQRIGNLQNTLYMGSATNAQTSLLGKNHCHSYQSVQ